MKHIVFLLILILQTRISNAQFKPLYNNGGQVSNSITTALPFIGITTNASQFAQGEVGVVANNYNYQSAMHSNPALLTRGNKVSGCSINYTPWLKNLRPNSSLRDLYLFLSIDSANSFGIKSTILKLGYIVITDINGVEIGVINPYEFLFQISYSHSFNKNFSIGISPKYIKSTIGNSNPGTPYEYNAQTIGTDFGLHYRNKIYSNDKIRITSNYGLAIQNFGSKLNYYNYLNKDFIPTNLALGAMVTANCNLNDYNTVSFDFSYEANKLLVPTPKPLSTMPTINYGSANNISVFDAAVQSFNDAPGGTKEELNEVIHKIGSELRVVSNQSLIIALRGGYFFESQFKGNRKFATTGFGISMKGLQFSFAYLIPKDRNNSPLAKTISLGISYTSNLKNILKN